MFLKTLIWAEVIFTFTCEIIGPCYLQVLLPAANLLQLADVRDACCDFLQSQLHPSNCLGIRAFADLHSCLDLLGNAEAFIEQHFSWVEIHHLCVGIKDSSSCKAAIFVLERFFEITRRFLSWGEESCNILSYFCSRFCALQCSGFLQLVMLCKEFGNTIARPFQDRNCSNLFLNRQLHYSLLLFIIFNL